MSKIAPLIKQAFGTSNAHEAASFLASAINRMKGWEKSQISKEVEAALAGVNFGRTAEAPNAAAGKTKTIYKDTPETERRLASFIRQVADLQREVDALKANRADPAEIKRLNARIESLTKEAAASERQHLEELAIVRAATQKDSAETVQLRQQVKERDGRITRLKQALAVAAEGGDASAAEREQIERRLTATLFDLAEAKRDLSTTQAELTKARGLAEMAIEHTEEAAELVEKLTAKGKELELQLNRQRATHKDELEEANRKRIAAGRRADDAERLTTQTKAKLKIEEYNGDQLGREKRALNARVEELTAAVKKHEEDAQHNYYQCESLSASLHLAQKELAELRHAKKYLFGTFHRASAYVSLTLGGLCVAIGAMNEGVNGAADSISAAALIVLMSYGVTRYLVKDM